MLREVVCLVIGACIVGAVVVDVVWTTLGTHGGGPLSEPVLSRVWSAAVALHRRRPRHRLLSFGGSVLLALLLALWVVTLWVGWVVIYSAKTDSLAEARTHQPATLAGRVYFVGAMISTSGSSDLLANGPRWRILAAINSASGIGIITLALTFLMQVLTAVVHKRTLGSYLSDLGGTPAKIVARSWDGENFDSLNDHLLGLTGMLHLYTEQHLAYPVLHYFHSERERTAATLRVAALDDLLMLLCEGAAPDVRPAPMVILPVRDALGGFAKMLSEEFIEPADQPPPMPRLSVLRDAGVPTVDDETFRRAVDEAEKTRRFFAGLLQHDGWPWEKVNGE